MNQNLLYVKYGLVALAVVVLGVLGFTQKVDVHTISIEITAVVGTLVVALGILNGGIARNPENANQGTSTPEGTVTATKTEVTKIVDKSGQQGFINPATLLFSLAIGAFTLFSVYFISGCNQSTAQQVATDASDVIQWTAGACEEVKGTPLDTWYIDVVCQVIDSAGNKKAITIRMSRKEYYAARSASRDAGGI